MNQSVDKLTNASEKAAIKSKLFLCSTPFSPNVVDEYTGNILH